MKPKNKLGRETKQKSMPKRKRRSRALLAAIGAISVASILVVALLFHSLANRPREDNNALESGPQPRAVIVDQLSITYPNQTFVETASNMLTQSGYSVYYAGGEDVTVEFYRNLARHGYKLIVLRVHSSTVYVQGYLFTSEQYSTTKYVQEQLFDQLLKFSFYDNSTYYFGITPSFMRSVAQGDFGNATIIMMGCDGLTGTDMARSFIEKGARAYISWNRGVSTIHADQAIIDLLRHLLKEKQSIKQAIALTNEEVGPDPVCGSTLIYYPLRAGILTVDEPVNDLVTASVEIQQTMSSGRKSNGLLEP